MNLTRVIRPTIVPAPVTLAALGLAALVGPLVARAEPAATRPGPANRVPNSGFEMPALGTKKFVGGPTGASWVFTGLAGISGNESGFTYGNSDAPEGTQVAFVQQHSWFSQKITRLAAGRYSFTFLAAQRGEGNSNVPVYGFPSDLQNVQVTLDGTVLGTFTPAGRTYSRYTTNTVAVSAGTHTLTFTGLNTAYLADPVRSDKKYAYAYDNTAFIDDVGYNFSPTPPKHPR